VSGGQLLGFTKLKLTAQSRAAKFASVTSLALFFPHNESEGDDEETTRVYYVGLRGSWRPVSEE
jgi:hypothetical protein